MEYTKKEIEQIKADASYWRTLGLLTGWTLLGFTFRNSATYATRGQSLTLTGSQRDDIVSAITRSAQGDRRF